MGRKGDDEAGDALDVSGDRREESSSSTSCIFFSRLTNSEPDVHFLSTGVFFWRFFCFFCLAFLSPRGRRVGQVSGVHQLRVNALLKKQSALCSS